MGTIDSESLDGGGRVAPVHFPEGSFLDEEDKPPSLAIRVKKELAEKAFDGSASIFVFNKNIDDAHDQPFYLMVENQVVGAVKLGHSFAVTEFEYKFMESKHQMEDAWVEDSFGYRVLKIEKFEEPIAVVSDSDDELLLSVEKWKSLTKAHILKSADTEERIVAAAVLVPNRTDLHEEIYDEDTVRAAAYYFMEHYLQDDDHGLDVMHDNEVVPDALRVLQSFVLDEERTYTIDAPVLDDEHPAKEKSEIVFPKGTWIMYVRVISDTLWEKVKTGEYTGWSIAGLARVTELRKLLSKAA